MTERTDGVSVMVGYYMAWSLIEGLINYAEVHFAAQVPLVHNTKF